MSPMVGNVSIVEVEKWFKLRFLIDFIIVEKGGKHMLKKKRTGMLAITTSLLISSSLVADAVSLGGELQTEEMNIQMKLQACDASINTMLAGAMQDPSCTLAYTNWFDVENDDEKNVSFLMQAGNVVGAYIAEYNNGIENAALVIGDFSEVTDVVRNEEDFVLVQTDTSLVLVSEDCSSVISGDELTAEQSVVLQSIFTEGEVACIRNAGENYVVEDVASTASIEFETLGTPIINYLIGTALEGRFLEVPFVTNSSVNGGLCWAASCASVINYFEDTTYDASAIYNALIAEYSGSFPVTGSAQNIEDVLDMYEYGYTHIATKLPYANVKASINAGKPLVCCFASTEYIYAHAVTLCGYYRISSSYFFVYMDSNIAGRSKYVINEVDINLIMLPFTDSYSFNYYAGGEDIYDEWRHSFSNIAPLN